MIQMSSKSWWWGDASGCGGCVSSCVSGCVSNFLLAPLLLLEAAGPRENLPSCCMPSSKKQLNSWFIGYIVSFAYNKTSVDQMTIGYSDNFVCIWVLIVNVGSIKF